MVSKLSLLIKIFLIQSLSFSQEFIPIPSSEAEDYKFDLEKNFFKNELEIGSQIGKIETNKARVINLLNSKNIKQNNWVEIFQLYNQIENDYRELDLYYYLKFAVNSNSYTPLEVADSIRTIILPVREILEEKIIKLYTNLPNQIKEIPQPYQYFALTKRNQRNKLSDSSQSLLKEFDYLINNQFYEESIRDIEFDSIIVDGKKIDLTSQRGQWENHKDSIVRQLGEKSIYAGYEEQKNFLGYNYIQFIRGLNAHAKAEGYNDYIEKKLETFEIDSSLLNRFFKEISLLSKLKSDDNYQTHPEIRFDIREATEILNSSLSIIGSDYGKEVSKLLNPKNGRLDIVGGENRVSIRGTASYLPIKQSVFYAQNYEGYLLDLTLLAHEIGHAVQATLMYNNNVPMAYGSGPAYFTESFGKFNELLLFDYLFEHETDLKLKYIYYKQLVERMFVITGSTLEAAVEYNLVDKIVKDKINKPTDLDNITLETALRYDPKRFGKNDFESGFWMLLETNFRAPFHNLHDMIASILALKYFQDYKTDKPRFLIEYNSLLKNGFNKPPSALLKDLNIDLSNPELFRDITALLEHYIMEK